MAKADGQQRGHRNWQAKTVKKAVRDDGNKQQESAAKE
jgi:hypothetical protein